jgi:predicted ABC-type sugar transport system permease subunit
LIVGGFSFSGGIGSIRIMTFGSLLGAELDCALTENASTEKVKANTIAWFMIFLRELLRYIFNSQSLPD